MAKKYKSGKYKYEITSSKNKKFKKIIRTDFTPNQMKYFARGYSKERTIEYPNKKRGVVRETRPRLKIKRIM